MHPRLNLCLFCWCSDCDLEGWRFESHGASCCTKTATHSHQILNTSYYVLKYCQYLRNWPVLVEMPLHCGQQRLLSSPSWNRSTLHSCNGTCIGDFGSLLAKWSGCALYMLPCMVQDEMYEMYVIACLMCKSVVISNCSAQFINGHGNPLIPLSSQAEPPYWESSDLLVPLNMYIGKLGIIASFLIRVHRWNYYEDW